MMDPVPLLTVGDLKTELSKWSDDTPVTFYSPLKEQEFRFYRYSPGARVLVLEVNEFPETSPVALPGAYHSGTHYAASCIAFFPFSRNNLEHNGRGRGFKSKRARADYGASPLD
jgi:hypothetical protein